MDPDAVATTRALLHRPSILNNFYLACTEASCVAGGSCACGIRFWPSDTD